MRKIHPGTLDAILHVIKQGNKYQAGTNHAMRSILMEPFLGLQEIEIKMPAPAPRHSTRITLKRHESASGKTISWHARCTPSEELRRFIPVPVRWNLIEEVSLTLHMDGTMSIFVPTRKGYSVNFSFPEDWGVVTAR